MKVGEREETLTEDHLEEEQEGEFLSLFEWSNELVNNFETLSDYKLVS